MRDWMLARTWLFREVRKSRGWRFFDSALVQDCCGQPQLAPSGTVDVVTVRCDA
jgi:hypothetical protein